MPVEITGPQTITCGEPIRFQYASDERLTGRLRLTAGTALVPFRLAREGEEPGEPSDAHRVRGRGGAYVLTEWGEHPPGTELVLRFEGRKLWMTVAG